MQPTWQTEDGRVRLYRAACADVLPLGGINVCVTDPPYELVAKGCGIVTKRKYMSDIEGHLDGGFNLAMLQQFPNWMAFCSKAQLPAMLQEAAKQRWMLLTWNKPNPTPLVNANYLPDTEYIVHSWQAGNLYGDYSDRSRFIVHPVEKNAFEHPTVKPLAVMLKCVALASKVGQTVCDPFCGTATTGVACIRTGRRFVGVERDPKYFDIAVKRIEKELAAYALFEPPPSIVTPQALFGGEA